MGIFKISKFKKAGSYLMELLIVVVGVSIAFQLSVWNDTRKSREVEKHLLQNFVTENRLNQAEIDTAIILMQSSMEANPALIELLKNPRSDMDSILLKMGRIYSTSWPDITSTHLDNYLGYSSASSPLKDEMLVLKTHYVSAKDLIDVYIVQKQQKYFDYLSDAVDITSGLEVVNKDKLFNIQFRNNLLMIYFYELALRETFDEIIISQKKVTELIEEQLEK
jgi:hypothetical protein